MEIFKNDLVLKGLNYKLYKTVRNLNDVKIFRLLLFLNPLNIMNTLKLNFKHPFIFIILLVTIFIIQGCAESSTNKKTKDIDQADIVNTLSKKVIEDNKNLIKAITKIFMESKNSPPGISIAISMDDTIVYAEGFGYANTQSKELVNSSTIFRAASVSKLITATAIAILLQENKIDLDQPVQNYVPTFPEKSYSITPRNIAAHIAGIAHYSDKDRFKKGFYNSIDESLTVFAHKKLLFEPGTNYKYSTHGFTLLSGVVEGITSTPFLEYINNEIFKPLKMTSTGPDLGDDKVANMSKLYSIDKFSNVSMVKKPDDSSYKWGGGGIVSTPSDLVRMGAIYYNGFLKPEIVKEMFKTQKLKSGEDTGVGIAWRRNWDTQGRKVFEHAGWMQGARSILSVFPEQKLSIAIMCNTQRPYEIEEMSHILALPFMMNSSPQNQPKGNAEIVFTSGNDEDKVIKKGKLYLDGSNDRLILEDKDGKTNTFKMMYLQRENLYGMITSYGVLLTSIDIVDNRLLGKSIKYARSPQQSPSTFENSFITFEGDFINE